MDDHSKLHLLADACAPDLAGSLKKYNAEIAFHAAMEAAGYVTYRNTGRRYRTPSGGYRSSLVRAAKAWATPARPPGSPE